jgi:hypothetical protein
MLQGLGLWLVAWIPTLVARVLVSLGITIVTMVGVDQALTQLIASMETQANNFSPTALALMQIGGFKQGLGIIVGAALMKFSMWTMLSGSRMLIRNLQ